jgi:hypothetical protein
MVKNLKAAAMGVVAAIDFFGQTRPTQPATVAATSDFRI